MVLNKDGAMEVGASLDKIAKRPNEELKILEFLTERNLRLHEMNEPQRTGIKIFKLLKTNQKLIRESKWKVCLVF